MHHRSTSSIISAALLAAAAACADPVAPGRPGTPGAAAAPRPAADGLLTSGLPLLPNLDGGAYVETFDLYLPQGVPAGNAWQAAPVLWLPNEAGGPALAGSPTIAPGYVDAAYDRSVLGGWSVVKHTRDAAFWRNVEGPFDAWHHPTTCNAPPASHPITSYEESVFLCRNHMMTAVNATGYGVTYLTPGRLVDLSAGAATVRFDVATLRETKNDWIDVWITPYDYNLVTPLDDELRGVDLQGQPRYGLHVRMTADRRDVSAFRAYLIAEHRSVPLPVASTAGYESRFTQSATVRQRFELQLTPTRLRFGLPSPIRDDKTIGPPLWWIDTPFPQALTGALTGRAVVQFGHHSMNPRADLGRPTTWHWDNIGISPAVPFTIVNTDRRYADAGNPRLTLRSPAPSGARLRFAAHGTSMQVSFDGGSWVTARRQQQAANVTSRFSSYWMSIPAGTRTVRFRGTGVAGFPGWFVRDVSVWAGRGDDVDDDDDDDG